jgi:pimeloyl-ACP methyl ester carboxylesterase
VFVLGLMVLPAAPASAGANGGRDLLPTPPELPVSDLEARVEHNGAGVWYATFGAGPPVILLHPGAASSDIWGYQVPALVADHHRVIVIDSRGHGRSSRAGRLGYELMESDVIAVMDAAGLDKADVVGWSDGAIVGLIMAMKHPDRVRRVFAFGADMDVGGLNPLGVFAPVLPRARALERAEYAHDTGSAAGFDALVRATRRMQLSQPNYRAAALAAIHGPAIAIADGDHDEVISHRHTQYLARTIPDAKLVWLPHAGHFAPLQAPDAFNAAVLDFLDQGGDAECFRRS